MIGCSILDASAHCHEQNTATPPHNDAVDAARQSTRSSQRGVGGGGAVRRQTTVDKTLTWIFLGGRDRRGGPDWQKKIT